MVGPDVQMLVFYGDSEGAKRLNLTWEDPFEEIFDTTIPFTQLGVKNIWLENKLSKRSFGEKCLFQKIWLK